MRISDWSSDVCSSDLHEMFLKYLGATEFILRYPHLSIAPKKLGCDLLERICHGRSSRSSRCRFGSLRSWNARAWFLADRTFFDIDRRRAGRSEEHTSELQSLMRISYAVFCLKKKKCNPILRTPHHK